MSVRTTKDVEKITVSLRAHSLARTEILCQDFTMRKLTAIFCLTISVFIGNSGISESGNLQKGATAVKSGDYVTALREWTPLAKQGNKEAQYLIGSMYHQGIGIPQNDKAAVKWYKLAAEQGHANAQTNLGSMYANGKGVIQDYVYALMWASLGAFNENSNSKGAELMAFCKKRMIPSQIADANKLSLECYRKKYKGC